MDITPADDLATLPPAQLLALVRELRAANARLRSPNSSPPTAAQSLLDEQLRRTSLLTQLAIEFRETLDPATIVGQSLRALAAHLQVGNASVILVGHGGAVELATAVSDAGLEPVPPELARELVERGLAGWALRHGSSVALADIARDRRWLAFSEPYSAGSVIVIPIRQSASTLGALTVQRAAPSAFSSHDLILLEGVAAQLGVALSAVRHQSGERQRRNQAMALLAMSQFLTAERTPAELAAVLHEKSVSVFGARAGFLFLADHEGELRPVLADDQPERALVSRAAGGARLAWAGQSIATTGPTPDSTCVALPLISRGEVLGAYALVHAREGSFSAAVWSLLTVFTHVIAAACVNMSLVARLSEQARALEGQVEQRTQQLQRSRDALRVVFDSLREGVLLLDADERVLAANQQFCQHIAGLHPREVVSRGYGQVWRSIERRGALAVAVQPAHAGGRQRLAVRQQLGARARSFLVERSPIGAEGGPAAQSIEFWREQA